MPGIGRIARQAHPTPQQLLTNTDLGRDMRHRTAGLDHQAGSLLPELRGVLLTLARHTDNLPAGPAVPPVRCPPSRVNPSRSCLSVLCVRVETIFGCGYLYLTRTVDALPTISVDID